MKSGAWVMVLLLASLAAAAMATRELQGASRELKATFFVDPATGQLIPAGGAVAPGFGTLQPMGMEEPEEPKEPKEPKNPFTPVFKVVRRLLKPTTELLSTILHVGGDIAIGFISND